MWLTIGRIRGIVPSIKLMARHDKSYLYSHIVPSGIYQPLTEEQKFQIEYDLTMGKMVEMGIIKIDEDNNVSLIRDMTDEDKREMHKFKKELGLTN